MVGNLTAGTVNGNTFTTGTYTLTGTAGKTLTFSNSLTLSGTDATTMTFPAASTTVAGLGTTQTFTGINTFTPAARSSGVASYLTVNVPADTAITAATESIGYQHVTGTRTWATTGTVALQRERFMAGPTYASAAASQTFTDVFNLYLTPPVAGTNAIFTRGHTLGIVDATSAASSITGGLVVATTLGTTATSVGIGGGNVNAGGLITGGTITSTGAFTASSTSTFTGATTHNNAVTIVGAAATTALTISNTARTSGVLPYIKWTIPTDTGLTASTESPGLLTVTGTRQWATGNITTQRENLFVGPTYAFVGASTITDGFTVGITPVLPGTNATITRQHSLGIVDSNAATSSITGGLIVATTLGTAIASVGIGGGNINAGGTILASTTAARIGYAISSGAGTAVSQATSRTTAVTSATPTGAITMFTAAGSATPATFTVNCTSIGAFDTVQYAVGSGATNVYLFATTAITAGTSFNVTFWTTGGTASDTPVVNYTIIKGANN